ncbi:unnamed protein product [Meloidogyne enterolobii]|uniref:Uncharacterized protein n=1 Tax=Meloidogyne enterolobii TaxID=390850 RepID=A0ACB0ZZU3_MELEN
MNDNDKNRPRPVLKEGEWACVDAKCAFINGEKRNTCQKCGKAKPRAKQRVGKEIGKEAAEKSKGLFAAEDWVCSKCGNVNWARRHMCNICNAPKLADLEVRTGYGGGYMDREDVEYIERDDADEEFDEFGRKKRRSKKYASSSNALNDDESQKSFEAEIVSSEVVKEEKVEKFEEKKEQEEEEAIDDEEDEDDEGGDLDKYDLTADMELTTFKDNLEILRKKMVIESRRDSMKKTNEQTARDSDSVDSSDCSCSCSGGDCSCIDSEEDERKDELEAKRIKLESERIIREQRLEKERTTENDFRRHPKSRDRERHRGEHRSRNHYHRNKKY